MKLRCIDTFSGIGGISLALSDFVDTVLYCEINDYCQKVLTERMEDGLIDKAPIHSDIQTLHIAPKMEANIIVGGFPCQDISSIGTRQGISQGARSSMFYHILRIVDECETISTVFLENVGNILKCGMKEVVDELTKRGFDLYWTTKSASSLGAPHVRNRWFCLACKPGTDLSTIERNIQSNLRKWENEPPARTVLKTAQHSNWIQRCQCLGNSVVPCVVREAFIELLRIHNGNTVLAQHLQSFESDINSLNYPYPESGMIYTNRFYSLPKKYQGVSNRLTITIKRGDEEIKLQHFPTPRRGISHASSLTNRSLHDLPTVLVYSSIDQLRGQGIQGDALHTFATANVNYIEWMMGYPTDWTKVKEQEQSKLIENDNDNANDNDNDNDNDNANENESENENEIPEILQSRPKPKPKCRLNGMHALMRDNPGKDIPTVAGMWRALSPEEKQRYTARARALSN